MPALRLNRVTLFATIALSTLGRVLAEPLVECHERSGLQNVFAKPETSNTLRVAYLGGSITEQEGWRPKTLKWFRDQFPAAKVEEINAAIGGTGSDLGVFRLKHDVLDHDPDLLFVEFAVNDRGAPTRSTWKRWSARWIRFARQVNLDPTR